MRATADLKRLISILLTSSPLKGNCSDTCSFGTVGAAVVDGLVRECLATNAVGYPLEIKVDLRKFIFFSWSWLLSEVHFMNLVASSKIGTFKKQLYQ
jgi:hypothetical protein